MAAAAAADIAEVIPEHFRHDFVDDIQELYKCPVCLLYLNDPTQYAECGHVYCRKCIDDWISASPAPCRCPVDNLVLDQSKLFTDKRVVREIGNLRVWCKNKGHGCERQTELNYLADHLTKCDHKPVECPVGCGQTIPSLWVEKHQNDECIKRQLVCDVCHEGMEAQHMPNHVNVCPMAGVECAHCDSGPMLRKKFLEEHEKTCEKTPTTCLFAALGCEEKMIRKDQQKHCEASAIPHLNLLTTAAYHLYSKVGINPMKNDPNKELSELLKEIANPEDDDDDDGADSLRKGMLKIQAENTNKFASISDDMGHLLETDVRHTEELVTLKAENQALKEKIEEMDTRHSQEFEILRDRYEAIISLHCKPVSTDDKFNICPFIWRVDILKCWNEKFGPVFYSRLGGYKLCLKAELVTRNYPEFSFDEANIKLYTLKGENDDIVDWPLTEQVKLTVTHVKTDAVMYNSTVPFTKASRERPDEKNELFLQYVDLKATAATRNDGNRTIDVLVRCYE